MDSDFWTSRLAAAKRQFNLHNHHRHHNHHHHRHTSQLDRLSIDDFEVVEDEVRSEFTCPYCYEDFDFASLCSHLQDQHSNDSKLTRRRRLRRAAIPSSQALSLLGRDLREAHLQVLLGGGGYQSNNVYSSNAVTDPFLSSLVLNYAASEAEEISKSVVSSAEETSLKTKAAVHKWKSSFDASLSYEEREKRTRQAAGRAAFVQDLLVSTMLGD